MNIPVLINEIESLPVGLQQQVADYVLFLKLKYRREKADEAEEAFDFTEEELGELDRRWDEYEAAPDAAANTDQLKSWVKAKYGS